MTAQNVYDIAKHLSYEELQLLYIMLNKHFNYNPNTKRKEKKIITDKEAIDFLIKNIFCKVRKQ